MLLAFSYFFIPKSEPTSRPQLIIKKSILQKKRTKLYRNMKKLFKIML
jgi:hypothetical protein